MSIVNRLASALGEKDEAPNIELALELCRSGNRADIEELVEKLASKNKAIQGDCIKVLYETGYREPQLISQYVYEFLSLLKSRNNRLVWGAMIALSTIADRKPGEIFNNLADMVEAIKNGSVITIDNGIKTLAIVASVDEKYNKEIFPFLIGHLKKCRPKDVPQHAESIQ